jgi:hypothetical protein
MANTVNQRVVIWARGHLGKQVGRGECWDVAEAALKNAKAQTSSDLGSVEPDDDYVWGDEIALKDVIAGDILQFRDFEVTTETVTEVTFADGSSETDTEDVTVERPHHTAVVDAVLGAGKFQILEQNVQPLGRRIQRHVLFTHGTSQVISVTQKMVKSESGKYAPARVEKTVTVIVSGSIWAYRPKANGS